MNLERMLFVLVIISILIHISWSDIIYRKIPNRAVLLLACCAVLNIAGYHEVTLLSALLGMCAVSLPLALLVFYRPGAFGGGDIKLMWAAGLLLGVFGILAGFCIAILLAGGYLMVMLCFGRIDRKTEIAFGPFLCAGIVAALCFGEELMVWYFGGI